MNLYSLPMSNQYLDEHGAVVHVGIRPSGLVYAGQSGVYCVWKIATPVATPTPPQDEPPILAQG